MKFKTIILTILLVSGISFQSCSDDECLCCTNGEYKAFFDIQDLQVKHWDVNQKQIENNSIRFEDYGFINLHFIVEYLVHQRNNRFNFSLINSAYGCSPLPPGEKGSKEEAFESLQIITLNDFDENHKAGDTINDLLEVVDFFQGNDPVLLNDFLLNHTGNVPSEYLILRILQAPTFNEDFQIRVIVNLSTGERYEEMSDIIKFI